MAVVCCFVIGAVGCDGSHSTTRDSATGPTDDVVAESFWGPISPVANLVDYPTTIDGDAPRPVEPVRWAGERAAEWTVAPDPSGAVITSPELGAHTDLTIFTFRFRSTGATEAIVTPLLLGGGKERGQRVMRSVRLALGTPSDGTHSTVASFDLTEAIHGNWLDETRKGELSRVEVLVVGADPETMVLEEVTGRLPGTRYGQAAAGTARVDRGGIIRPGWFVHGGRLIRVKARIPEEAPELRWHAGGTAQRVRILVASRDSESEDPGVELARHPGSTEPWTFHSVSLAQWRNQDVTLEFSIEDEGLGFFGDPRIVSAGKREGQPLSIVYMVDTLRADRVGAWKSETPTDTPVFDKLAAEGAVFKTAISTSSWTKPAIPTLMTGIAPRTHLVGSRSYADRLPESVPIMQQVYRDAGWRTLSISASPLGSSLSGLDRGFGTAVLPRYWRTRIGKRNYATASDLHDALLEWHAEEPDRPALVYLHTIDVHQYERPFYRSEAFAGVHPYDAAVGEADRQLGELLDMIESTPSKPDLAMVIVSDHGESFGDHGIHGHGRGLYQTQIHVPLIYWAPGRIDAREVEDPVSLIDFAPTMVEMAGLAFPARVQGRSLVPYLRGKSREQSGYLGASLMYFPWEPEGVKQFALLSGQKKKLIVTSEGKGWAFDLNTDPSEAHSIDPPPQSLMTDMQDWLAEQMAAADEFVLEHTVTPPGLIDAAQTEQLRELGYIE